MCHNAWPWAHAQLSLWMCQLLFGHLNGLLPLSYQDSRHGSLSSCLSLSGADVHLCFDRYHDYSTKSSTRSARATNNHFHHLTLTTPLSAWDTVLNNYTNKAWLNALICEQVLSDNDFLRNSTQNHKLVVTEHKSEPMQVSDGQKNSPCGSFFNAWRGRYLPYSTSHPYCQRRSRINSLCGFRWHWHICFATVLLLEWEASINNDYAVTN